MLSKDSRPDLQISWINGEHAELAMEPACAAAQHMLHAQVEDKVKNGQDMQPRPTYKMVPALYSALDWRYDGRYELTHKKADGTSNTTTTMKYTGSESTRHVFRDFDVDSNYRRHLVHQNGNIAQEENVEVKIIFIAYLQ
jgi:hypothetical protein